MWSKLFRNYKRRVKKIRIRKKLNDLITAITLILTLFVKRKRIIIDLITAILKKIKRRRISK